MHGANEAPDLCWQKKRNGLKGEKEEEGKKGEKTSAEAPSASLSGVGAPPERHLLLKR